MEVGWCLGCACWGSLIVLLQRRGGMGYGLRFEGASWFDK